MVGRQQAYGVYTASVWSVLQWQVWENQLVVIPHWYVANTHFWGLKEVQWVMLSIQLQRWLLQRSRDCCAEVRAPDLKVAEGSPEQHNLVHCMCCRLHNRETALQRAPPQVFLGWENYPLAALQLAFLGIYLPCPLCWKCQDTSWAGAVLAFAARRECWQAAGLIRDWNGDQECQNCSLCRAALIKDTFCHHL